MVTDNLITFRKNLFIFYFLTLYVCVSVILIVYFLIAMYELI